MTLILMLPKAVGEGRRAKVSVDLAPLTNGFSDPRSSEILNAMRPSHLVTGGGNGRQGSR